MSANNKPLNEKLNLTVEECNVKVSQLYACGYPQAKIADILNVNRTTIERYFKRNKLKSRKFDDRPLAIKHCNLSSNDMEVINGLMLGDGCLSKTSDLSARLVFSGNHLHLLEEVFPNLKFNRWSGTLINKPPGSHEFKQYKSHRLKSHSYAELLEIRNKWYKNVKIIPDDLILTPITCYWWFVGDGCCSRSDTNHYRVFLCTDCFTHKENTLLVDKLRQLDISSRIDDRNRIVFCKAREDGQVLKFANSTVKHYDYAVEGAKFLNYMKSNVKIHDEYAYKFKPIN